MYAIKAVSAALLLAGAVSAAPPAGTRIMRPRANPTDVWVTVDESGHPRTVTPVMTTISGTPTLLSAAPNDLTATVVTQTDNGEVRTSTFTAVNPTATAADGSGFFAACHNKDGDNRPFCEPQPLAQLYPSKTYYITWDPTFFNGSNSTVQVIGNYFNATTGQTTSQAFQSDMLSAAWGFFALSVTSSMLLNQGAKNVSLSIVAVAGGMRNTSFGPTITLTNPPIYHQDPAQLPTGEALYIALPTVFVFIGIMLCGTCLWNRRARKIGLGNIMSRSRNGYGVGKSRAQRMLARGMRRQEKAEQGIRLMDREVAPEDQYRDDATRHPGAEPRQRGRPETPRRDVNRHGDFDFGMPRRDSDALGSLAGTPTEERQMDFGRSGSGLAAPAGSGRGNAFRDELNRQNQERF